MSTDSDGNYTGEYTNGYSEPIKAKGVISMAKGELDYSGFGTDINYDKTIILNGIEWDIDEHTGLFIDKEPTGEDDVDFDYLVVSVAESLNFTQLAIKKVRA